LPLFPGYLFCQFDINSRFPILSVPGVNFIVGTGKTPIPIAMSEIEAIRTLVTSGLAYEPHPYLDVGQLVQIEYGSLAGLTGLIVEVKDSCRLVLSINLLMRSVSAEIDRRWVRPIELSSPPYTLLPHAFVPPIVQPKAKAG
jgi:transcriptional antiterminator NusG